MRQQYKAARIFQNKYLHNSTPIACTRIQWKFLQQHTEAEEADLQAGRTRSFKKQGKTESAPTQSAKNERWLRSIEKRGLIIQVFVPLLMWLLMLYRVPLECSGKAEPESGRGTREMCIAIENKMIVIS